MAEIDRGRLRELMGREVRRFEETHPRSGTEWAGPWPVFTAEAHGARLTDLDRNTWTSA